MEKKYLDLTGLQDVAGHVNTRLKTVTTMPLSADNGAVRLYVGNTTNTYIQGHIYQYDLANTEWKDITATSSSASAYHAAGTKTVAELTSSLLVEANEGNVYNITDSGVTTADFIEGAGKPIRVGDNVGICEPTSGTYKFDLLSGFITIDSVPTDGSTNPVESNGVYDALAEKDANIIANTELIKDTVGWSGKNLLGYKVGASYNASGVMVDSTHGVISAIIPVSVGDKFIASKKTALSSADSNMMARQFDSNGTFVSSVKALDKADLSGVYTVPSGIAYVGFVQFYNDGTISQSIVDTYEMMLRKANILDSTYEPYRGTTAFPRDEQRVLGAKNFWIIYSRKYYKADGITYTINDDNSVTANGTTSSNKVSVLRFFMVLPKGTYILSGGKSTGEFVALYNRSTSQYFPNTTSTGGDTRPFTFNEDTEVGFTIRISSNKTVNNLTFYPMVRLSTDMDDTYVAPAFTNKKLTTNMFPKDEQMILGAKNILPDAKSKTLTGVTYIVEDGVVNVNGTTPSSSSSNYIFAAVIGDGRNYLLSGGNETLGESPTPLGLYALDVSSASPVQMNVIGTESILLTMPKGHRFEFHIIVRAGNTVTNQKVYPMLRLATDENDTFAPYSKTNRELTLGLYGKLDMINGVFADPATPTVGDIYNSEEQVVGTWGRQGHEKTLYMSALMSNGNILFNTENSEIVETNSYNIANIDEIVFAQFTCKPSSANVWSPLPHKKKYITIDRTDIIGYTSNSSNEQAAIKGLVYYTKTS